MSQTLPDAISAANLSVVLHNLGQKVAKLDGPGAASLVQAVIGYKWLAVAETEDRYAQFMDTYSLFLVVLVSLYPKYMNDIAHKIIGEFTDVTADLNNYHHRVLRKIILYVPTCISVLPQIMQRHYPHHLSLLPKELLNYSLNLIITIGYCPELQFNLWQLIIESCIKLDVELQNELDDLDDEEIDQVLNPEEDDEAADELVIRKDDDDSDEDEDDDSDEDEDDEEDGEEAYLDTEVDSAASIRKLSHKLDGVIHNLITSTNNRFTVDELNNGDGVTLFNTLTLLFRLHVLPTHFTKLIQFIHFYISQYQPELADLFLVLLIDVAFSPQENLEVRLKSIQYLSSYIARARQLSRHQVVFVALYLVGWLNKFIAERELEIGNGDAVGGMERFKLFYAALQALFYIFCFRHHMLVKEGEADEWECELDKFFTRVIVTKFNPLKYCDETVVAIFAKLASKLNVCFCYTIIEHNKRERMLLTSGEKMLPSAVGNFRQRQEFLDLEAYFPFDPLVLPLLKLVINKWYVEWLEVNPDDDEEDDDLSDG